MIVRFCQATPDFLHRRVCVRHIIRQDIGYGPNSARKKRGNSRTFLQLFFGLLLTTSFLAISANSCLAQDAEDVPRRHISAPDSCVAFASWAGWGKFQTSGSPTEKWMAQKELKEGYKKLKKEVFSFIKHLNRDAKNEEGVLGSGVANLIYSVLENPGFFYLEEVEIEDETELKFHLSVSLKGQFEGVKKANKVLLERIENDGQKWSLEQEDFRGTLFHTIKVPGMKNRICWSVSDGKLVIVSSETMLRTWKLNRKTDQPVWLERLKDNYKVPRLQSVTYINLEKVFETFVGDEPPKFFEELGLDHFKRVSIVSGLGSQGSVVKGGLECDSTNLPIFSFLPNSGFSPKQFQHVKKSDSYLAGIKIDTKKLLQLVDKIAEVSGQRNAMADMFIEADSNGIDVKALMEAMGPNVVFSGKFALPDPTLGLGLTMDVSNKKVFKEQTENLSQFLKKQTANIPEEVRPKFQSKKGIHSVEFPFSGTQKLVVAYNDGKVALAANRRKANQFLKGKRAATKLTEYPVVRNVFDSDFQANGRPVFLMVADPTPAIKVGYPMLHAFASPGQTVPGTKLTTKDLPPLDVVVKDWQPITAAMHRTDKGLVFSLQTTTPLISPPVLLGVTSGMILPGLQSARASARRTASMNNIRQILLGLHVYHDSKGCFPARYSSTRKGKQLLSWRVHMLPFMGEEKLYKKFKLDQPWNSPHNKKLIDQMPRYLEPVSYDLEEGMTSYQAVYGEGAAFDEPKRPGSLTGKKMADFKDGTSNSVMILEMGEKGGVVWTKPDDFDFTKKDAMKKLQKAGRNGFTQAGFADGRVQMMKLDRPWEEFKKLFTISAKD